MNGRDDIGKFQIDNTIFIFYQPGRIHEVSDLVPVLEKSELFDGKRDAFKIIRVGKFIR